MTTALQSIRHFVVRRRRWGFAAGTLLVLYAGTGFLLFPWVLHRQLERRLGAALRREVTVQRVRANPFALSLTIDGLLVKDRDGSPFISWDRLYVNGRLLPILKRELDLDALQLVRLRARVSLAKDGSLNFSDLLNQAPEAAPSPADTSAPPSRPFVFGIDHLALEQAQLDFTDTSRARPFHTTVGPVTIRLDDFRTRADAKSPYAFSGTTEAGETFSWSGSLHIDPIRSEGTLTLDGIRLPKYAPYYEQSVDYDLLDGTVRVQGDYQLDWGPERRLLRLSDGALALRKLVLRLRGAAEPSVELPELDVRGVQVDLLEQVAAVESVSMRGLSVRAARGADGRIDLSRLAPHAAEPTPGQKLAKAAKPFRWTLHKVQVSEGRVVFSDALPERPVKLVLAPVAVTVGNLASERTAVSTLAFSAGWNGTGQLKADGSFSLSKPAADLALHLQGLTLPPVDGYLPLYGGVDARLGDGRLTMDGRVRVDLAPDPFVYGFDGDASIDALVLLDAQRGQEIIRWKALQVLGIHLATPPQGFSARSVRWMEPRVKVQIAEDGSSNVRRMLRTATAPPPGGAAPVAPPKADASAPTPVSIATFQIVRGNVGLVDRSVQPVALFGMSDLDLRVRGLSNDVAARAQVELQATVGGGPLKVSGTLSPRMKNDATDLRVTSKGIDLTPLGPYFGKYVGFALEKGKLDLDLGYKVSQRHLDAQNLVRVDQLTLGEETHSPDATKLPVKLGLAVLQDRDGVIELDVPVDGNVDDPDFRLGKLIWHAVGNVFAKIVTAPFAALGALFGGGSERLDLVDFAVGTLDLDARGEKTLQNLAKALYSRPALQLEIQGTVDAAADGAVLRREALRRRAREEKWKAQQGRRGGAASLDKVEVLEDEYVKFIEAEYRRAFPQDAKPATPPTTSDLEARLLATVDLGPEALAALARRRAEVARDRILQGGQVEPARLFLVQGAELAEREKGAHVYFTLK